MMPEESYNALETALGYYDECGWFVFPAAPRAKTPYAGFRWKPYGDNLPAREEVASWPQWGAKDARVAARTGAVSGIVVLDVDSKEAHNFIKANGHPIGPMVRSPREDGGLHLYFRHPGFYVKSTVAVGGVEGLDVRGDGGIVVVPPSPEHSSGRAYEWIIPPEDVAMPGLPEWLLEILRTQSEFKDRLDVPKIMAGVPEGQRDTELNRLAGKFRQMNLQQDIAERMIEWAAENCNPPFNKAEARAKVKWAWTHYEPGEDVGPVLDVSSKNGKVDEGVFTAGELLEEEYPPVKWIVPDLLPEGSMIFAGKPKMGKSWLALAVCVAVASGGKALGQFECEPGDVLYLALEDNKRRLQSRLKELIQSDARGPGPLDRLAMKVRSKRLDAGLLQEIEEWLENHPKARVVVIDTLGSVRGKSTDRRTLYEQDYEVGTALTQLANDHGIALLIIHHLRKGDAEDVLDMISGSTGLTGGMDGAMVLTRTRSAADGILKAVHRDLEDDPEMALQKVEAAEGWWRYAGDAEEYRMSKERREILDVMQNEGVAMKPAQVAEALDKQAKAVSKLMLDMTEDGYLDRTEPWGYYKINEAAEGGLPPNLGRSGRTDRSLSGNRGFEGSSDTSNPIPNGSTSTTSTTSNDTPSSKHVMPDGPNDLYEEESEWWD